jgi:signal transduction histidine kinase
VEHKFLKVFQAVSGEEFGQNQHLDDLVNIMRLYNFKNLHLFGPGHQQLYSTDTTLYEEQLLAMVDSAVMQDSLKLGLIDASRVSPDNQTLLLYYVPVLSNDRRVGIVLVEENFDNIQSIVSETTGMGTTGESYIAGPEFRMKSYSRFSPARPPGEIIVKTEAVANALQGSSGSGVITDYRGERVLSVYRPIRADRLNWVIISEIDWTEAMQPVVQLRYYLIGITFFVIFLTTAVTFFLSNAIVQPILNLKKVINRLALGIFPTGRVRVSSNDEVGQMADAIYHLSSGLARTSAFAKEIGAGNFDAHFEKLSEHDTLGEALIHMRDALKDLSEREKKVARARASALLEGQENERRRIIKELHDGVGQLLTAVRMRVEMIDGDNGLKDEIKSRINETIGEVRRISYNVMPQALVDFGLEAALRGLCDSFKRYANMEVDFNYVKEVEHNVNFEVSTALFRIAQEGLNNIVKHAGATSVNLHVIDKEEEIYMMLEDDGKGFNTSLKKEGMGLQNIHERAELLNGTVQIHSTAGEGTTIEVFIPITTP